MDSLLDIHFSIQLVGFIHLNGMTGSYKLWSPWDSQLGRTMASRALGRTIRQWGPRVAGAVGQGRGMIFVKVSQRPWEHKQKPRSSDFPGPLR